MYCRLSGCCLPLYLLELYSAESLPPNPAINLPLQSLNSLVNPALISCNWLWLYYTFTQWKLWETVPVNTNDYCEASNPNYQVTFTHKWHISSPHLYLLLLVICSWASYLTKLRESTAQMARAFWPSIYFAWVLLPLVITQATIYYFCYERYSTSAFSISPGSVVPNNK